MSAIETDDFLAHPPQAVWQALTDPAKLARWLMPTTFVPVIGHRFTFTTMPVPRQGFDGIVHCQVLQLRAPELLSISWRTSDLDTTVTWRLVPEGRGTRLLLSHDGFDDRNPHPQATMRILGSGWRGHMITRLHQVLDSAWFAE